jgi:cytochrome P450
MTQASLKVLHRSYMGRVPRQGVAFCLDKRLRRNTMSEAIKMFTSEAEDYAYTTALEDLDVSNPSLWDDQSYWPIFERMRNEAPLHYCKEGFETPGRLGGDEDAPAVGGYWSVTRYEDIMEIDTNHKVFSSEPVIALPDPEEDFTLPMFIAMDQPKHDVQRKTVAPAVSPQSLANMTSLIRERTIHVLDSLPIGEEFDWVDKVSIELTTMMLATLFDFPFEDRRKLTRWSDVATAGPETGIVDSLEQRRAELFECLEYFTKLWNERVNAEPSFDLISMLAHGEETKNMDPLEYLGNLILLIVGGNDTTRNSMTASIYATSLFPTEWDKLQKDPELVPNAVAEIIRWQTPLPYMRRTALEDYEMHGKTIKKGDKIAMWYVSGNRDERKFERPNDLIVDRANARNHISFGFGIHRCFGNRLAELQLQILWQEMLKRFERVEVLDKPTFNHSSFVKGYTKMMVKVHAK